MARIAHTARPRLTDADRSDLTRAAKDMLEALRVHGAGEDGSVTRLVYTDVWQAAMGEIESWFSDAGLQLSVDAVGSRFGRLPGDAGGVVLAGSHVDSVKRGGAYDGALGVVLATCALRWLHEACGRPVHTLEVLAGCEEESSRFPGDFWATRAILGLISPEELERRRDPEGISIGEAMIRCGLDSGSIATAARSDIAAFVEPHVEQGPVLETGGLDIGVVDTVVGVRQLELTLTGSTGHAGTTPMAARQDPLVAAAEIALEARALALDVGEGAVATVGCVEVDPGGANQVPGRVRMTIDFRHSQDTVLDRMQGQLIARARDTAGRSSVEMSDDVRLSQRPASFDPHLLKVVQHACESVGCGWTRMRSGAGHDAQLMANHLPAAMFFVPSRGGVSHRPDEYTDITHVVTGIEVLIWTLFELGYSRRG